jgi:hypothetical protein
MRHLGVAAVLSGVRTVPRLWMLYPGIRLKTEKKQGKKVSLDVEKCLLDTINYVNLAQLLKP